MDSSSGSAVFWLFCGGLFFIGIGLMSLFARDLSWDLTEWQNRWKGVSSERTEAWEAGQTLSGVVMLLIGAGVLCFGVTNIHSDNVERMQDEEQATQIAATHVAEASSLQSDFAEFIPQWQSDDTPGVHHVSLPRLARNIYYGRCEGGYFYVYIQGYHRDQDEDYAYIPDRHPDYCHPTGMSFGWFDDTFELDAGWYDVSIDSERAKIITPTPSPTRATATPNPTQLQATLDAAIARQLTAAAADVNLSITQTIDAAVRGTLEAVIQQTLAPTPSAQP